jgi:chromosome segregation ATPase
MSNTELEKSEHEVRDLEYRSNGIKDKVAFIDQEVVLLSLKELALQDNIKNLKKNSIIVLASEFKRSKDDLIKTKNLLDFKRKEREDLDKALKQTLTFLGKAKLKLDALREAAENNVLQGRWKL